MFRSKVHIFLGFLAVLDNMYIFQFAAGAQGLLAFVLTPCYELQIVSKKER